MGSANRRGGDGDNGKLWDEAKDEKKWVHDKFEELNLACDERENVRPRLRMTA